MPHQIPAPLLTLLSQCTATSAMIFLPPGQLPRATYLAVAAVLKKAGGAWDRKAQGHRFAETTDAAALLDTLLLTGYCTDLRREYGFFETPPDLAATMVGLAGIRPGESVCEPSAGRAALAHLLPDPACYELEPGNRAWLQRAGYHVAGQDFLATQQPYDVFVANPPFGGGQAVAHLTHMLDLAQRSVVCIMPAGLTFRADRSHQTLRERLEAAQAAILPLPGKTFHSAGTDVNTCLVHWTRP